MLIKAYAERKLNSGREEKKLQRFRLLAEKTGWSMAFLAALAIVLRLLLLPHCPVPVPSGSDDFSYLLLGDTLAHFRLANPTHPLYPFFESIFVLQQPAYSSIFPPGQGMALAFGEVIFGHPWAGVLLSTAAFCAFSFWMLRGWVAPEWALVGGLLAVLEFGPLNQWTNTYWGGGVSAIAGCLVYGSLPRMRVSARARYPALLGAGLGLELLTRPFEFVLLCVAVLLFFAPAVRRLWQWRGLARSAGLAALCVVPAVVLLLLHNAAVTGSWRTMPYVISRYEYGVPTTFTFQSVPTPHRGLNREEELDYRAQSIIHGDGTDTVRAYFERLAFRVRYYRFFFFAPLYVAILAFLWSMREFRLVWVLLAIVIFALGTNFYPYFYAHYVAAITCLFLLVSVVGLERMSRLKIRKWPVGSQASKIILGLCAAQFVFWYGMHLFAGESLWLLFRYQTRGYINYGDPEGRIFISDQLTRAPGKQLVVVRYGPQHGFHEWVHNGADIDSQHVVWAHDLGAAENRKLLDYYRDRTAWLLLPDAHPPALIRY